MYKSKNIYNAAVFIKPWLNFAQNGTLTLTMWTDHVELNSSTGKQIRPSAVSLLDL